MTVCVLPGMLPGVDHFAEYRKPWPATTAARARAIDDAVRLVYREARTAILPHPGIGVVATSFGPRLAVRLTRGPSLLVCEGDEDEGYYYTMRVEKTLPREDFVLTTARLVALFAGEMGLVSPELAHLDAFRDALALPTPAAMNYRRDGLTADEIAAVVGLPEDVVRARLRATPKGPEESGVFEVVRLSARRDAVAP